MPSSHIKMYPIAPFSLENLFMPPPCSYPCGLSKTRASASLEQTETDDYRLGLLTETVDYD